jgi:hypothetical protein
VVLTPGTDITEVQTVNDPILFWNDVANEANRVTHTTGAPAEGAARGPCGSSRAYAIVHLAMHDAWFSVAPGDDGTWHPNGPAVPVAADGTWLDAADIPAVPAGADAAAAVAGAAHAALSALYPAQQAYFDSVRDLGLVSGPGRAAGLAFGAGVAAAVLAARAGDPSTGDAGHVSSDAPGRHRHDPDAPATEHGYHAPFYGAASSCFAVTKRHHLDAPPQLNSAAYLTALAEIRAKGIAPGLMGTLPAGAAARTPRETVIGLFWGYDGAKGLGTPPRLYNQIVRVVADDKGNSIAQNARLFALVNAAMGDAGILAWDDKYAYDLWRPVLGLREHDGSLGPLGTPGDIGADGDPGWLPLGAPRTNDTRKNFTPPFPAYPSGHATFGAASLQSTRLFYDEGCGYDPDDLADGLLFVSDELDGISRDNAGTVRPRHARAFPDGLWEMIEENGRSRVYLGVHWVFDAFAVDEDGAIDLTPQVGGVRLGLDIAGDLAASGLRSSNAAGPRPGA